MAPDDGIQFELTDEHRNAIKQLAGERGARLAGKVEDGRLVIDFLACNAPFLACNASFVAVNAPFKKTPEELG